MNLSAMPEKLQTIHIESPLQGRYVSEVEVLHTDDGLIAEVSLRGRLWTAEPFFVHAQDWPTLYRQIGRAIEHEIETRGAHL